MGEPSAAESSFAEATEVTTFVSSSGDGYDLFDPQEVRTLSDGRVAVLNAGSYEVLVFSPTGQLVLRFGRRGQGPGEFVRPLFMGTVPGDSILVTDLLLPQRTTVFSSDGVVARTFALDTLSGSEGQSLYVFPIGITADRILVASRGVEPTTVNASPGVRRIPSVTMLYDLEGSVRATVQQPDRQSEYFLVESEGQLRVVTPPPLRGLYTAVGPAGVALAMSDLGIVTLWGSDGADRGTAEIPPPRMPITSSMIDEMRREWAAEPEDEAARRLRSAAVQEAPMPSAMPVVSDLEIDRAGRVWVREATPSTESLARWHVHDGATPVGYVDLPAELEVKEIGADYVLAVSADSLDVESIVRVRLQTR